MGAFQMNATRKTAGAISALALVLASILQPAHAADEEPLAAAGSTAGVLAPETTNNADDTQSAAVQEWRALMAQNPPPDKGCFHAAYPNAWEKVDCDPVRRGSVVADRNGDSQGLDRGLRWVGAGRSPASH
jgi:hypothetical protein